MVAGGETLQAPANGSTGASGAPGSRGGGNTPLLRGRFPVMNFHFKCSGEENNARLVVLFARTLGELVGVCVMATGMCCTPVLCLPLGSTFSASLTV